MEENETITPDGQVDESQLNSAAPEAAVSTESPENLTLAELNTILGKDFKDKATALKSVKDTFSYVGKRKEDIAKEVGGSNETLASELRQIKENMFFDKNPDYVQYRDLMAKMGTNPEEVANSKEFKSIYEKAVGFDASQKLKSVLVSNPRLASSKDNLAKAREAQQSGNNDLAENLIARAVLDSIEQ